VFLNCVNAMQVIDLHDGTWETVHIPADALAFMRTEAEQLRNSREWPNGTDFSSAKVKLP